MGSRKTHLTIRVQARGGKFLADDIGGASVTVRDVRTGEVLVSGVTRGSSGDLVAQTFSEHKGSCTLSTPSSAQIGAASKNLVVTPNPGAAPTVNWLVADPTSSRFVAELEIEQPTQLEISTYGPLGGLQSAHQVTTTTWVVPGETGPPEPGFVIEIPGLLVQVQKPTIHTELGTLPATIPIKVNVAMMCGCPIKDGEPWLPGDFEVAAHIQKVGSRKVDVVPLTYDHKKNIAGRFVGSYKVTAHGKDKPIYYEARITAVQKSTGNSGTGLVTFFYEPS